MNFMQIHPRRFPFICWKNPWIFALRKLELKQKALKALPKQMNNPNILKWISHSSFKAQYSDSSFSLCLIPHLLHFCHFLNSLLKLNWLYYFSSELNTSMKSSFNFLMSRKRDITTFHTCNHIILFSISCQYLINSIPYKTSPLIKLLS